MQPPSSTMLGPRAKRGFGMEACLSIPAEVPIGLLRV